MSDQESFNQTLQDRITVLKKKQRELELIAKVVDFASKLPTDEVEFKDVAEKVSSLFVSFSNRAMDNLNPSEKPAVKAPVRPTPPAPAEPSDLVMPPAPPRQPADMGVGEKLKFLQSWRHLEKAKVKVGDKSGTVRGLDAPHVIIVTEGDETIKVLPETLEVVKKGR